MVSGAAAGPAGSGLRPRAQSVVQVQRPVLEEGTVNQ